MVAFLIIASFLMAFWLAGMLVMDLIEYLIKKDI